MKKFFVYLMIAAMLAFVACSPKEQPTPQQQEQKDKSADPSQEPSQEPSQDPSQEPSPDPSQEPEPSPDPSQEPVEPGAVSIGDQQFDTIQEAVDAAQDGDELILNEAAYRENIKIGAKRITMDGQSKVVLTGSIELTASPATIKNLVIEPDGSVVLEGATGWDSYPYGIRVNDGGQGFDVENVVIDMAGIKARGNGSGVLYLNATGTTLDKLAGCTILGEGQRAMQAYGAKLALIGNKIINPYKSYGIRIGGADANVEIAGNTFESESDVATAIHLNGLEGGTVVFGNGEEDDNSYAKSYKNRVDGTATGTTFRPAITIPVSNQASAVTITNIWRKANFDSWFGTGGVPDVVASDVDEFVADWYRNVAMDDQYLYVSESSKTASGILAIDIKDPSKVQALDVTGVSDGTFFTNCVRTIQNGDKTIILASNLSFEGQWAGPGDTQTLKLYAWQSKDSAPTQILNFPLDDAVRLGDKFQVYGDWNDGLLFFKNYTGGEKEDMVYIFSIKNGVVNSTPVKKRLNGIPEGWAVSAVSAYYPYTADSGIMAGWNAIIPYEADGDNFKCQYWTGDFQGTDYTMYNHGVNFFTLGGQEYIFWVHILDKNSELRLYAKDGDFVETCSTSANLTTALLLGDESGEDVGSANGAGDACVRVINGVAYAAVAIPGHGLGMFEIK